MSVLYTAWVAEHYICGRVVAKDVSRADAVDAVVAAARRSKQKAYTEQFTVSAERDGEAIVWDRSPLPGPFPMGAIRAQGAPAQAPTKVQAFKPPPPPPPPQASKAPPPPPPPPPQASKAPPPPPPVRK